MAEVKRETCCWTMAEENRGIRKLLPDADLLSDLVVYLNTVGVVGIVVYGSYR